MKPLITFFTIFSTFWMHSQCIQNIAVGDSHNILLKTDGTLWSWGSNSAGQLGLNIGNELVFDPNLINSSSDWSKVFAGNSSSFAIKSDGTLWVWGNGSAGQLGLGNQNHVYFPTQSGTANDWEYIYPGSHTIAKKTDGTLWGWGNNIRGQLNLGTNSIELNPVQISTETNWRTIAAGGLHTLAIKNDGTLWACGKNDRGQLGDGTTVDKLNFVQIGSDNDWLELNNRGDYSMALKTDGTIWGWGGNSVYWQTYYIFGDNFPSDILIPILISNDTDWNKISTKYFLIGRKTNGTLWRINGNTQIGNDNDWIDFYGGGGHLFAFKADNTLWGYGNNNLGQLGIGYTPDSNISTPTQLQLDCTPLDVDETVEEAILSVYPNPAINQLSIVAKDKKLTALIVYDIYGNLLINLENLDTFNYDLSVSNLSRGFIIIKFILEGESTFCRKVILK